MQDTLELIGLSREELQRRVVDRLCKEILDGRLVNPDNSEDFIVTGIRKELNERIQDQVERRLEALVNTDIIPKIDEMLATLTFQKTNTYGEPKSKPETIREFAERMLKEYWNEPVTNLGKTRAEESYNFRGDTTRAMFRIQQFLNVHLETEFKKKLTEANGLVKGGLEAALKMALEQALAKVKVQVTTN